MMFKLTFLIVQEDKGGKPEIVRESQRKRGASVELVDEVIAIFADHKKRKWYDQPRLSGHHSSPTVRSYLQRRDNDLRLLCPSQYHILTLSFSPIRAREHSSTTQLATKGDWSDQKGQRGCERALGEKGGN